MQRVAPLVLAAAGALALAPAAQAQAELQGWRRELDPLLDRWANDLEPGRLKRARGLVRAQAAATPDDAEVLLELARLELAADDPAPALAAADRCVDRIAAVERQERARARERAREREEGPAPDAVAGEAGPAPELLERRGAALALAFLAQRAQLNAELARTRDEEATRRTIEALEPVIERRRASLAATVGPEGARALLRAEAVRLHTLRNLDRLGAPPAPIGQPDADGDPVDLTVYRGRPLLILFWSGAPIDCGEVVAEVEAVRRKVADRGLAVLGVCLDADAAAAAERVAKDGLGWRHVFAPEGLIGRDARAWKVATLPSGVLVDGAGRVRYVDPWELGLEQAVEDLLARGAPR